MHFTKSAAFLPCMLVMASTMAFAQQPAGLPQPTRQRAYVSALSGATFGPETAAMFAGEYGERISRNVQAYVTISYHEDLMDAAIRDDLSQLSAGLTAVTGVPWSLQGRDRGVAMIVGGRYLFGNSAIRPFIGGGGGVINVRRTITDPQVGDVTTAVLTEFGIGQLSLTTEAVTGPLVEANVGVSVSAGRATYFDVGYRYRKAFHVSDDLAFGQFSAGVGVRF